jgi:predicted ATPase/class 3 adenylate cyclase
MTNQPSGTVTFLFTDIEGSTRIAQEYPDRWDALRERHHAILREAFESHRGYIFQIIGDAFCATFHTADDALRAAVKSQIDLQHEAWDAASINVRMGIHTGQAEIQPTGDYHGFLTMSRVQRIMSAAHGGQVLISQAAEMLIHNDLPDGVTLRDMGERRLKDLIQPEHIYQLMVSGLRADFPPIRTLDVYRHNLPAQTSSFIGREMEMAEIKKAVSEHRLVTLTGSGGTGKTRLSLQVGADLLDQFPDGVWFIELAPLTNPDLIPQTVLSVFGIGEASGKTAAETLYDHARNKKLLLVLDNCEHLIEACAVLAAELLSRSPGLKILASSREALGVKGEMAWHVPSLTLPDVKKLSPADELVQFESVRLFVERATLVHPHFQLTEGNASFIAQICSRLDGIPLALELAAARVKTLSVDQIAARLNDRFRLLTGGARTALPRQQTLRALIEWSYNLLSNDEKILCRRLAVFVGRWRLEAAETVCGSERSGFDILEILTHLVDKSLVNVEDNVDGLQYRLLESTRQYARDMLMMSDEVEEFRERHLEYYLSFAESAAVELKGRGQASWMSRLEVEHDNLRAALEWSLESQPEYGLRIAVALLEFWDTHGHITEARKWVESMLSATSELPPTPTRVKALYGLMGLTSRQSDMALTQALLEEGFALAQTIGDKEGVAQGLSFRGFIKEMLENNVELAEALHNEALDIWRGLGDKLRIGQALGPLASCAIKSHDYARAENLFKESLALFREVENEKEIAGALWNLAEIAILRRKYESAQALAEESLALYRELDDKHGIATALRALSVAAGNQGSSDQALTASEQSAEIFREIGDVDCMAITLAVLARQVYAQSDLQRAASLIYESVKIFHDVGNKIEESSALDVRGRITLAQGNIAEAKEYFRDGLILQRELKDERTVSSLLEGLAHAMASASQHKDAVRLLSAAQALRERIGLERMNMEGSEYEQAISSLHERVNKSAFERLWNEGCDMSEVEAIELALRGS